ncbi:MULTISPECIES: epoxide hydrolase family protein [unclassified Streptomyces]|uniref:epoxide hydrolase family protein n=1 Tax=unclassified Streptomyces TaxID=2593676 RepID=UPI00226D5B21|nr:MULTISPECIES: epoxide hydrolase family protein [unclassified Streptomyces]MCY0920773.1 epoxide hydrolase [Streptomyces sp. H27-G5]MCY0962568.1 epoxide hydrolase [Streptomyces sp. H27-H5]
MGDLGQGFREFRLDVGEGELDDLRRRLERVRWPDELSGVGWAYGMPLSEVKELVRYWREEYDWRAAEARINGWAQYTTEIDGAAVHFAHLRSPEPHATPLLMTHGWPGSFVEFQRVAGPLTDPRAHGGDPADAFHLVLPHIPGFALSGPTTEPGWEFQRVARAFGTLMERLGYERYGVQGGDWGAAVSRELGRVRPANVVGVHLNLLPGAGATSEPTPEELAPLDPAERERARASWERYRGWARERQGYADIQSTRPQTLAYALNDSPVGLLAWIGEKFAEWSDPRTPVDRDRMLTNVMLYWLTGTVGSAARIYYERAHADYHGQPPEVSRTPTALADFPRDNFIPLRHIAERTDHIVRWTSYDKGGHFPAMEVPESLVEDVRAFFRQLRAGSAS